MDGVGEARGILISLIDPTDNVLLPWSYMEHGIACILQQAINVQITPISCTAVLSRHIKASGGNMASMVRQASQLEWLVLRCTLPEHR